jgi:hypothetical protein
MKNFNNFNNFNDFNDFNNFIIKKRFREKYSLESILSRWIFLDNKFEIFLGILTIII